MLTTQTLAFTELQRLRFSLRSLFVLVTVAAIGLGYTLNWIQQRHLLLASQAIIPVNMVDLRPSYVTMVRRALWLVGEQPVMALQFSSHQTTYSEVRWAFPEANVYPRPNPDS